MNIVDPQESGKSLKESVVFKTFLYGSIITIVVIIFLSIFFPEIIGSEKPSFFFWFVFFILYAFTLIGSAFILLWIGANQTATKTNQLNVGSIQKETLVYHRLFINLNFLSLFTLFIRSLLTGNYFFAITYFILCIANIIIAILFGYRNKNVLGQVIISLLLSIFMIITDLNNL